MVLPWHSRPTFFKRPKKDSSPQHVCKFWLSLYMRTCHAWCQRKWCFDRILNSIFWFQNCSANSWLVVRNRNKQSLASSASPSESTMPALSWISTNLARDQVCKARRRRKPSWARIVQWNCLKAVLMIYNEESYWNGLVGGTPILTPMCRRSMINKPHPYSVVS